MERKKTKIVRFIILLLCVAFNMSAQEATDFMQIKKGIKKEFEKWAQKGYEKEFSYQERLRTQSQEAFSQICVEQTKKRIRGMNVNSALRDYNAEDEYFVVSLSVSRNDEGEGSAVREERLKKSWEGKVNVPPKNAELCRKNWGIMSVVNNDYDWCFVDNLLFPTLVTMTENLNNNNYRKIGISKCKFTLSLQNQQDISYSFDDLGINNPYLKGFVFNYSAMSKEFDEKYNSEEKRKISNEIYTHAEQMPAFPGGDKEMNKWLSDNIKYPATAKENGIQGTVWIRFVVLANGSITDVEVTRSLEPTCNKEAIRLIESMPKWEPGRQNGNAVNVFYSVPVVFKLKGGK